MCGVLITLKNQSVLVIVYYFRFLSFSTLLLTRGRMSTQVSLLALSRDVLLRKYLAASAENPPGHRYPKSSDAIARVYSAIYRSVNSPVQG